MAAVSHRRETSVTGFGFGAKVLLIESDVASRLTLQTLLRAGGYSVDVAADGRWGPFKLDDGITSWSDLTGTWSPRSRSWRPRLCARQGMQNPLPPW